MSNLGGLDCCKKGSPVQINEEDTIRFCEKCGAKFEKRSYGWCQVIRPYEQNTALDLSIEKWEEKLKILKDNIGGLFHSLNIHLGVDFCPLCIINECDCKTCIVKKTSGKFLCQGTPYEEIVFEYRKPNNISVDIRLINLFQKEVDFLKSLRKF